MDKAKAAVSDFMSKSGHHDTTVHESVAPGVQRETVKPHKHENITTAVDKEIHQDHYHRTVQPVQDREVLPEQHHHNLGAVQHKQFDHRDHEGTKRALASDQGGYKDERTVHDTTHTQQAAPTVSGEHVHHHIHETIQPVVHKETIEPHVVHTTVPVHETHHHAAKHHNTSELAPVSMAEFKQKGGVLGGREEKYDGFEGEPKNIGGSLAGLVGKGKRDSHHADNGQNHGQHGLEGKHEYERGHEHGRTGPESGMMSGNRAVETGLGAGAGSGLMNQQGPTTGRAGAGPGTGMETGARGTETGLGAGAGKGMLNQQAPTTGGTTQTQPGVGAGVGGRDTTPASTTTTGATGTKPGLLQKLNPLKDADGDGKKGFMD